MRSPGLMRTSMGIYILCEDTHLSRQVEAESRLDTCANVEEIASFAHLIPEGGMVIDAGACLGDHTITYSQLVGGEGCVYAFEPHPLVFQALALNMSRFSNVHVFQQGLSDKHGRARFRSDANVGASRVADDGEIEIRVSTLDEFFSSQDVPRCDFIHLDAEGMETRILQGGRSLVERFHPTLVVEVCDAHLRRCGSSEDELTSLIRAWGYAIQPIPGHADPALRDVLCVHGRAA